MLLKECNVFFEAFALANDGTNHGSSYTIESLPAAASLEKSLAIHFSSLSTSASPSLPAENWQIVVQSLQGSCDQVLTSYFRRWFFNQEFSPKLDDWVQDNIIKAIMCRMELLVGIGHTSKITLCPPMWYECVWEDVAIENGANRWLLQFGFSD